MSRDTDRGRRGGGRGGRRGRQPRPKAARGRSLVGERFTADVDRFGHGGFGVARLDAATDPSVGEVAGTVVFVRHPDWEARRAARHVARIEAARPRGWVADEEEPEA